MTQVNLKLTDSQYTTEQLKEKLNNTKIWKGRDGWQAETQVKSVKGYDWKISTFKSGTALVTTAQAGMFTNERGYDVFSFQIIGDPRVRLFEIRERCTQNTITNLHTKGLSAFVNKFELNSFKPTHN